MKHKLFKQIRFFSIVFFTTTLSFGAVSSSTTHEGSFPQANHWRIGATFSFLHVRGEEGNALGWIANGSYFFNSEAALSGFIGSVNGGFDFEYLPIKFNLDFLKNNSTFRLGPVSGAGLHKNVFSLHLGARALYDFDPKWSLTAITRASDSIFTLETGAVFHM